jgi:hypothetical protein
MKLLSSYLRIFDSSDDQIITAEGSCQWLDSRDDFQDWRDPPDDLIADHDRRSNSRNPSIFWVHANPGTGKTFLAAHIISQLSQYKLECAYYYFHIGRKASQSLAGLLRSLAHQMASTNACIREQLTKLCEDESTFDLDDARAIWTRIFRKGIFQVSLNSLGRLSAS